MGEALAAVLTLERFLAAVDAHVLLQVVLELEGLAARWLRALELAQHSVLVLRTDNRGERPIHIACKKYRASRQASTHPYCENKIWLGACYRLLRASTSSVGIVFLINSNNGYC